MTPPANRRRRRCESTRTEGHALVAEQSILDKQQQQQQQRRRSLRRRMEGGRICGKRKGMIKFGSFVGVMVAGLTAGWGTGGANAQFIDGGAVAMDCNVCSCAGSTSDDGTIEVFDNPSSGERVRQLLCRVRSSRQSAEMNFTDDFCDFYDGDAACRCILMSLVYIVFNERTPWTHTRIYKLRVYFRVWSLVYFCPLNPGEIAFRRWNKLCILPTRGDMRSCQA